MDKNGTIYDYVNGQEDLKNNYVRFIGVASERVQEDYLRILRYFRFWAKLGHGKVDNKAITACKTYANKLETISSERKRYEFFEILSLPHSDKTLKLMQECDILKYITPTAHIADLTQFLSVYPQAGIEEQLAVLTQNTPIHLPLSKIQKKLLNTFNQPVLLSEDIKSERLRLYHLGERTYHFHIYHAVAQKRITEKTATTLLALSIPTFPIKGQDFIDLGYLAGPEIAQYMKSAKSIWAECDFPNNKELVLKQFLMYNNR